MTDFDQVKKLASLPTRVFPLCLAGEIVEEIADLERQLAQLPPATSLAGNGRRELAERIVAAQERMREATVDFRLRAQPARVWQPFWSGMPERAETESEDAWQGRIFPFYAELVSRTVVDPAMTTAQVGELVDIISAGSWNRLGNACIAVNMGEVDVPNSDAASELIGLSEQT